MSEIETRSTPWDTAECSPISLRLSEFVRLVFLPTLVKNIANPNACVRGQFVYQRKLKNDNWAPIATIPLNSLKSGEGFKLELKSDELLTLMKGLGAYYRLFLQQGIPKGRNTFVKLEASLAKFLALGEADLTDFLNSNQEAAAITLLKLIKWLANSPQRDQAASRLAELAPEQLPSLNAILGLTATKNALAHWRRNQANGSEEFWQNALSENAFVLSQVFAYPVVVIQSKAYLGGKQITNKGGKVVDFLAAVESTDSVILIEIKTPRTSLLGNRYRSDVFPLSLELSGAISQVLRYRQQLMQDFRNLAATNKRSLLVGEPRCLVVAGNASEQLTDGVLKENFELMRERVQGVTIVTYDELFRRLEIVTELLE
jgi:hypothetical protein